MARTWIALLRGVNVGGAHKLNMKELAALLTSEGLSNVRTYIQSGNVVFEADDEDDERALSNRISRVIERASGFRPGVHILTEEALRQAMDANPFPEATSEPSRLHLFFLMGQPDRPDFECLRSLQSPTERFELKEGVLYLHAPDGIGRSKLAASIGRCLRVEMTARNLRTVKKLSELV